MNRPNYLRILCVAAAVTALLSSSATAAISLPQCDITNLPCLTPGKKCNIKFRNQTGEASGSGGNVYNQVSRARTIHIRVRGTDDGQLGSQMNITAGGKKTMDVGLRESDGIGNITIRVGKIAELSDEAMVITMSCAEIKYVLKGKGNCKVFVFKKHSKYNAAYSCNGSSIKGDAGGYKIFG